MDKKILIVFVVFLVMIFAMFFVANNNSSEEEPLKEEETTNSEHYIVGNITNMAVYQTDFIYYTDGYSYIKVNLTDEQGLRNDLAKLDLYDKVDDVVYGKYKIVIDGRTLFFDLDTDSGLWLEENITFRFPKSIKEKYFTSNEICSCCPSPDKCKLNACVCINN